MTGKKTSVYLSEQTAERAQASGTPLAELIKRGLDVGEPSPLTRQEAIAALRALRQGITRALAVLGDTPGRQQHSWEDVAAAIPEKGIRTRELAILMRLHGFDPRAIGAFVRRGDLHVVERYGTADALYTTGDKP